MRGAFKATYGQADQIKMNQTLQIDPTPFVNVTDPFVIGIQIGTQTDADFNETDTDKQT